MFRLYVKHRTLLRRPTYHKAYESFVNRLRNDGIKSLYAKIDELVHPLSDHLTSVMDDNVSVLNSEMLEMAGGLPNRERLLDGLDANTCTLASITAAYKAHKSKITTDFENLMKTAIDKVTKELPVLVCNGKAPPWP